MPPLGVPHGGVPALVVPPVGVGVPPVGVPVAVPKYRSQ